MSFNLSTQDLWVKEYNSNIYLQIQQLTERTRKYLPVYTINGEAERFQKLGKLGAMTPMTIEAGNTNPTGVEFEARWLTTSPYKDARVISKNQTAKLGNITSPLSRIISAQVAQVARKFDEIACAGIIGTAYEGGSAPTVQVPWNENFSTIPVGFKESGAYAASGLTLDKLLRVSEIFGLRNVFGQNVEPQELSGPEVIMFITAKQKTQLLRDEKVSSFFYNSERPLMNDQIYDYAGVRFVVVPPEVLPLGTRKTGAAATDQADSCNYTGADVANVRTCIAFVRNSVAFGLTDSVITRMDELPMRDYAWQCFMQVQYGCTRIDDLGVLKIDCAE